MENNRCYLDFNKYNLFLLLGFVMKLMQRQSFTRTFPWEGSKTILNEERSRRPDIVEVVTRLEEALKLQLARENRPIKHLQTNNFALENIITEFRNGTIFKGRLLHSQQFIDIAAKKFFSSDIKRESKKIWTEIFMLSSLNHKNLVSIIGFCDEERMKIIIYNRVNKSLQSYLSDKTLKWMQRLKICVGVAKALSYIHYDAGRDFSVIQCNIRSSKILLDDEWEPKLSGFELSLKNAVARRHRHFYS
ncbi:kinase-like domain, phloem protein 2-like protein [Tanacetum coccineum]